MLGVDKGFNWKGMGVEGIQRLGVMLCGRECVTGWDGVDDGMGEGVVGFTSMLVIVQ